ncbi:prepilin peptidase [Bacillus sp. APMAM]|nr:prepilin peptidase [Bacillus sp. APMAM]RTZ56078.1 prepilin peptidase [Bacillus sp. SAJ1]
MNIFWTIYFAVVGLILGSFFNVVGLRIPEKKSLIYPGSQCPHCKHKLRWFELIPVFSFIFQLGKCRSCKTSISYIYPVMEAITGCLYAFTYAKLGWEIELLFALLLLSLIVIITVSDLIYMIIPDKILLIFTVIFIILKIMFPSEPWWDPIVGAVFGFALLFLIAILSKGAMGGGDIKLFFVLGIILGLKYTFLTFLIATFLGAVFGILMMIARKYKKRKPIPFGPFIGAGAILSFFFGDNIISWYVSMFM